MKLPRCITNWDDVPVIFDIPVCCILLGKSYDRIKKMCQKHEIPAFKFGAEWRFRKDEIMKWASSDHKAATHQHGGEETWTGSRHGQA